MRLVVVVHGVAVHEEEEWARVTAAVEEGARAGEQVGGAVVVGAAAGRNAAQRLQPARGVVVVVLKAAPEAVAGVEEAAVGEGRRLVAARGELAGEGRHLPRDGGAAVDGAVAMRVSAGEK